MVELRWTFEANKWLREIHGHYRIAYEIIDSSTIAILGIFHGKMVIKNHLK